MKIIQKKFYRFKYYSYICIVIIKTNKMINFAPFISMLLRKKRTTEPRELTENAKKEIAKINDMGFFTAVDYLANKDDEKVTYCGACGGDASHCDGC